MSSKKNPRKSRTSKGIHGTTRAGSTSTGMQRLLNQYDAFLKGKNVRVAVPTPYKHTAVVRRSAKDVWGDKRKGAQK